jgi:hypothetical protein
MNTSLLTHFACIHVSSAATYLYEINCLKFENLCEREEHLWSTNPWTAKLHNRTVSHRNPHSTSTDYLQMTTDIDNLKVCLLH